VSVAASLGPLTPRACPICGNTDESHERYAERIDTARLGALSYSSRKEPEYVNLRMVVCPACELLYAPRVPPAEYLERAYAGTGFDAAGEARHAAASYAEALRARLHELPDRQSALEIGAGNGAFLAQLRSLGFAEVIGIEPSIAAVRDAAPEVRPLIRVESFDPGDLPQAHFSLVAANQTIEHVAEPLALLAAVRALLKPDGLLMMVSHDYRHPLMRLLGSRSPIIDIEHLQVFSRASLRAALERAGFAAVRIAPFANRYPLHYWIRLAPLPRLVKRPLHGWLRGRAERGLAGRTLRASVGNMIAWARWGPV
jgi:SAM-dependent methyltransferase